jgi:hypothetical protein
MKLCRHDLYALLAVVLLISYAQFSMKVTYVTLWS